VAGEVGTLRAASRELIAALIRWSCAPDVLRLTYARRKVSILVYHDPTPEVLDAHLSYLSRRYSFLAMTEFAEARRSGRPLPKNALIVTFDDGHRGNVRLVPVLRRYGVVPTIYLCTQVVATNRHFWWTEAGSQVEELKKLPSEARLAALATMGYSQETEFPERQALSIGEIEELRPHVDFGAHTRHHPILTRCSDDECEAEISGSKREVETIAGATCRHFSYPNGDMGRREVELVRQAGFNTARTTAPGWNDDTTSLFALRVIGAPDDASINRLAASVIVMFAKSLLQSRHGRADPRSALPVAGSAVAR
jgi:peptidoglycan/xylan/chitin deacetylase (PgdA/CDA1 family)